jgi:uncharacterized protein (TIGR03086 family)
MLATPDATAVAGLHTGAVTEAGSPEALDRRVTELIGLGRDREAAELAGTRQRSAPIPTTPTTELPVRGSQQHGGTMDVLQQLQLVGPALGGVVANITPDQLDNSTPCAKFTVRGVLEHMVGGATAFTAAFRGEEAPAADLSDPLHSFGPSLGALVGAIAEPGALDRTVAAPFGQVPGRDFAQFIVLDGTVHGYDMAVATGQVYEPDTAVVEHLLVFAGPALEHMRDGEAFAEATVAPAGATPIQRLAALTGRTVV